MKTNSKWPSGGVLFLILFAFTVNVWAGQPWLCEREVSGLICEIIYKIDDDPSAIAVVEPDEDFFCNGLESCCADSDSWVYVYGIPFYHLAKKHFVDLEEGNWVDIMAHDCPMEKEDGRLKACTISVNGGEEITIFPPNQNTQKAKNWK